MDKLDSSPLTQIAQHQLQVLEIRDRAFRLFQNGATGIQIGAALSDGFDNLLKNLIAELLTDSSEDVAKLLSQHSAVIAVGGSGRGEISPHSDLDLLFLYDPAVRTEFTEMSSVLVRQLWDAKLKLGHSVRTVPDSIAMARQEPQFATSLVDMRLIWGSEELLSLLQKRFLRKIVSGRLQGFVSDCVRGRLEERDEFGSTVLQLEPDIKRSLGGLRDVHLLRWIGFAHFGTSDPNSLRLRGAISREDSRRLLEAYEYLMRIRADMHFHAGKPQDILTRDEQLRIAEARGFEATDGLRPVERFMLQYFHQSSAIAEISQRFSQGHQRRPLVSRLLGGMLSHRFDNHCRLSPEGVTVHLEERDRVCSDLEASLRLFLAAARYRVGLTADLLQTIKQNVPRMPDEVTLESARVFRRILRTRGNLGSTLRSLFETGLLELLIPDFRHIRCLLQFNAYHHYTVDEHTFRALEIVEQFEADDGPIGTAYRSIQHKATLHLALLLHDAGKGYEEDHSEVGRRIAERTGLRLHFGEHKREMLVFLVHKHLEMAHLAFFRDISDPSILISFARSVGSPEILRMLYVLTAADITAVGPNTWNDWKAELLTSLYESAMLILSGKHLRHFESQRVDAVKREVRETLLENDSFEHEDGPQWIEEELDRFPPHYLFNVSPAKIADDLSVLRTLGDQGIHTDAAYDHETDTVEYRIIARGKASDGCFHKICGVLTANRLAILEAQINTSLDETIVDRFRVSDHDYSGEIPQVRMDEVGEAIQRVLAGQTSVTDLFLRHRKFGGQYEQTPISDQVSRVVIDNDSTQHATIIDVFAHDRPGLLYTVSRAVYERGLSVKLAKIGTHLDQVVDVFYVSDASGQKLPDGPVIKDLRRGLAECLDEFEQSGHRQFIP